MVLILVTTQLVGTIFEREMANITEEINSTGEDKKELFFLYPPLGNAHSDLIDTPPHA